MTGTMTKFCHILPLFCLSIAFLILNITAQEEQKRYYLDDEYYCRRNVSDSQICHRCLEPEQEGGCPKNEEDKDMCKCNDIAVYDWYRGRLHSK